MADDILKQFVVSLGWKIDRDGERRVTETVTGMTRSVGTLVGALAAAAAAAVAATTKIAASFDQLYFVSQRTGASAQNIKSLSYAFDQVGSSGGVAVGVVESFARAMRTNPGVGGFVRSLGVATSANGKARDSIDVLFDAVDAIQKRHPYFVGAQMAALLGIDEASFETLTRYNKEIKSFRAEYDRTARQIGLNNDEATVASNKFWTSLRSLQATITAVAQKLAVDLVPHLAAFIDRIRDWLAANPDEIRRIMSDIAKAVAALAKAFVAVVDGLRPIAAGFQNIAQALTGKEGLQASFEAFAIFLVTKWLTQILLTFGRVGIGWQAMLAILGIGGLAYGIKRGATEGWPQDSGSHTGESGPEQSAGSGIGSGLKEAWQKRPKWLGGTGGEAPGKPLGKLAGNANAHTIIKTLREAGYPDNSIAAIVGSMQSESSFNPRAANNSGGGHTGLWQWDRNRWPRVKRWIESQGGDPYDTAWQTKAWIAEHDAKPGDPMYDHAKTAKAGRIFRGDPSLPEAMEGVRESERYGRNEEGGRGANARRWLPEVQKRIAASASSLGDPPPRVLGPESMGFVSPRTIGKMEDIARNMEFSKTRMPTMGGGATYNNGATNNVTASPNVSIHIQGGNAEENARSVSRAMESVNESNLRNVRSAVR